MPHPSVSAARRALRAAVSDRAVRTLRAGVKTARLLADRRQSMPYRPGDDRKGRLRTALDHARWVARHGEVYDGYFLLGRDAEGGPPASDLHSSRRLMALINASIQERGDDDLADLLKDKFRFAAVAEELGHPSPRNLAFLTPTGVERLPGPADEVPYETLGEWDGIDGFCKPVRGQHGGGAFALRVEGGAVLVDGRPASPADVRARVRRRSLLQDRVEQRAEVDALYPGSINTVRLVTAHKDGRVWPFEAAVRIGAHGSVVDNWSAGGLMARLDLETGRIVGRGFYKPGSRPYASGALMSVSHHPDTGVELDGYPLPDFAAAVDLVCRFHRDLGGLLTIAWDVALTPAGPVVIEGNTHWDGRVHMAFDPTFEGRYGRLLGVS